MTFLDMAKKNSTITSWDKRPLGIVLQDNITVPPYQRAYSWDTDNISDFINDLEDFISSDYDSYLFGQMIFYEDDGTIEIIDGQQRLSTTVIFLSVLRRIYREFGIDFYNDFNDDVTKCLGKKSYGHDEFKLIMGKINRDYFLRTIQYDPPEIVEPTNNSDKLIKSAYDQMYEYYNKKVQETPVVDRQNLLKKYYDYVTNKYYVSSIKTNDSAQAYIIFETLNTRGKDLDATDILKNYFIRVCNADEIVLKRWEAMIEKINILQNEPPRNFIRAYWNSKYANGSQYARKKDLFKKIDKEINKDSIKASNFVKELNDLCETYIAALDPDNSKVFDNEKLNNSLISLKLAKARSHIPILLALKNQRYSESEIAEVIYDLEVLMYRNIVMGNENANAYESDFSVLACKISNDVPLSDIRKEIWNKTYSDSKFQFYFNNYVPNSDSIAKIVLRELYNYNKGERPIKKSTRQITLEHIMPQDNSKWAKDEKFWKAYVGRLGNMTLLLNKLNSSANNDLLEDKKNDYEKSEIEETKALIFVKSTEDWDETIINDRQQYLFDIAHKRWYIGDAEKRDSEPLKEDNKWSIIVAKQNEALAKQNEVSVTKQIE